MTWSTLAVAAAAAGTLFVGGRALNTGTGSSPCADLAALEAPALEGELDEASILCLEGLGSENAERLLAIQHFSSGDMDAWARTVGSLVKRTVEAGTLDPDLGYKYLLHLSAEDRMNPGIPQLVEDVLDASSVWPKPLRIERSNSLLKLATVYALNQWKDGQTDQQRMATGEAARRWFEHSQRHDLEIEKAQELCNLAGADCL